MDIPSPQDVFGALPYRDIPSLFFSCFPLFVLCICLWVLSNQGAGYKAASRHMLCLSHLAFRSNAGNTLFATIIPICMLIVSLWHTISEKSLFYVQYCLDSAVWSVLQPFTGLESLKPKHRIDFTLTPNTILSNDFTYPQSAVIPYSELPKYSGSLWGFIFYIYNTVFNGYVQLFYSGNTPVLYWIYKAMLFYVCLRALSLGLQSLRITTGSSYVYRKWHMPLIFSIIVAISNPSFSILLKLFGMPMTFSMDYSRPILYTLMFLIINFNPVISTYDGPVRIQSTILLLCGLNFLFSPPPLDIFELSTGFISAFLIMGIFLAIITSQKLLACFAICVGVICISIPNVFGISAVSIKLFISIFVFAIAGHLCYLSDIAMFFIRLRNWGTIKYILACICFAIAFFCLPFSSHAYPSIFSGSQLLSYIDYELPSLYSICIYHQKAQLGMFAAKFTAFLLPNFVLGNTSRTSRIVYIGAILFCVVTAMNSSAWNAVGPGFIVLAVSLYLLYKC